jgi:hypothetical protein
MTAGRASPAEVFLLWAFDGKMERSIDIFVGERLASSKMVGGWALESMTREH